jgi:hypothetical protein
MLSNALVQSCPSQHLTYSEETAQTTALCSSQSLIYDLVGNFVHFCNAMAHLLFAYASESVATKNVFNNLGLTMVQESLYFHYAVF